MILEVMAAYGLSGMKVKARMPERTHTFHELAKMEKIRNFLLDENVIDQDSFEDYQNSL